MFYLLYGSQNCNIVFHSKVINFSFCIHLLCTPVLSRFLENIFYKKILDLKNLISATHGTACHRQFERQQLWSTLNLFRLMSRPMCKQTDFLPMFYGYRY